MKRKVILLAPHDNVAIAVGALDLGDAVSVGEQQLVACDPIPDGHKLATRAIAAGEKVVRYNVPIGSASEAIQAGAWVHTHNLKSDYIPTFTFDTPSPDQTESQS